MATSSAALDGRTAVSGHTAFEARYYLLLIGAALALLSVGGRWDIALAAWVAPVLLLRFGRSTSALPAILVLWLVQIAAALFWSFQLNVPMQLSTVIIDTVFATVYTVPYAADRLAYDRLSTLGRLMLFPSVIVVSEFVMGTLSPLGTAYGMRAVTQNGNLPLLQLVAVTGPYGIGFLIGWAATVANWAWETPLPWKNGRVVIGTFALALVAVLIGGAARLAFFTPSTSYVRIAGITPSVAVINRAKHTLGGDFPKNAEAVTHIEPAKLQAAYDLINQELLATTQQAARGGAQMVIWSETAGQVVPAGKPALLARAANVARQNNIFLIVTNGIAFARNETHLIDPDGKTLWAYQKRYPVPGLEFVPPGSVPVPVVQTPFGRISNVICFDADFPALTRVRADIMLVPGYDWPEMGRTHTLKMASLRAIENGYSLFRQDFNGQSAAFDHQGRVLATQDTTPGGRHIMYADVPTRGAPTIYNRIGDLFSWLCVAAAAGLLAMAFVRPVAKSSSLPYPG